MEQLGEAYHRNSNHGRDPRRVLAGSALLVAGGLALVAAILTLAAGGATLAAKQQSGLLAGLGIPAMLGGVVVVLPASRRERLGVCAGAGLTLLGVFLFWHAYPGQWTGTANSLAFETAMVYFAGGAVALWYVFSTMATFRRRNSPAGTVTMELVRESGTREVEVSRDRYRRLVSDGGDASEIIREIED